MRPPSTETKPRFIDTDAPELDPWGRKNIAKHHGPGPHPGTMSPQSVHGSGGGGGGTRPPRKEPESEGGAVPIEDRVRKWNTKDLERFNGMWNRGENVRGNTDAGIAEVWDRMQQDPRWSDDLFDGLGDNVPPLFDDIYANAEDLVQQMFSNAQELGATWDDMDSITSPYDFITFMDTYALEQGSDVTDAGIDGFEIEELGDMTGETVFTTEEISDWITDDTNSYNYQDVLVNARFEVLGIDPETGMVRLERQAHDLPSDDGLGPIEGLGGLLPGGKGGMGPEVIEVDYKTIMGSSLDTSNRYGDQERLILSSDELTRIQGNLENLDQNFDAFESQIGMSPQDAISYIDMGDYSNFSGDLNPGQSEGLVVNDSYGGSGITVATRPDEVPMALRNLWANTSNDEHRWAIAVQMAVAEEFDLDTLPITELTQRAFDVRDEARETFSDYGTGLQVYARAVYDTTQQYLSDARDSGLIDGGPLPVVRGMGLSESVYRDHYSGVMTNDINSATKVWPAVEVSLNPLSSFSTNANTARTFSKRGNNDPFVSLTRAYVPQEQIWGMSQLGHGSYRESEVIVLGGDDSLVAEMMIARRY